jgi:hypothetical protein
MKRKTSREKRLSANKSRVTSPSPKKKTRWDDNPGDQNTSNVSAPDPSKNLNVSGPEPKKQRISLTTSGVRPSIPQSRSPRGSENTHERRAQPSPTAR